MFIRESPELFSAEINNRCHMGGNVGKKRKRGSVKEKKERGNER
jgi:hypothetical protein